LKVRRATKGTHKRNKIDTVNTTVKALFLHSNFMTKRQIQSISRADLMKVDFVFTTQEFVVRADQATKAHDDIRVMGRLGIKGERPDKLRWINNRTRAQADDPSVVGAGILFKTPWPLAVSDECRFINFTTKGFQAMLSIFAEDYLCLTGTPTRNYATDVWSLFRWMQYQTVLVPQQSSSSSSSLHRNSKGFQAWSVDLIDKHDLRAALVQTTHADCSFQMPELKNIDYFVEMSADEQRINLHYLKLTLCLVNNIRFSKTNIWDPAAFAAVLGAFTRLRQVAVAPYLVCTNSKRNQRQSNQRKSTGLKTPESQLENTTASCNDDSETSSSDDDESAIVYRLCCKDGPQSAAGIGSSKMQALVRVVQQHTQPADKVLIFGNFTSSLDLAAAALARVGVQSVFLDGSTKDRAGVVEQFKTDAALKVMCITYPVGSVGLNLTCANHVVFLEPWYNHAVLEQAAARAWRFGQLHKTVYVHQLITTGTIEPEMLKICAQKQALAAEVLSGTKPAASLSTEKQNSAKVRLNLATIARMVEECLANQGLANQGGAKKTKPIGNKTTSKTKTKLDKTSVVTCTATSEHPPQKKCKRGRGGSRQNPIIMLK
jgi:hypothetical protein